MTIPLSLYLDYCGCWYSYISQYSVSYPFITLDPYAPSYTISPGLLDFSIVGTYSVSFYTTIDYGDGNSGTYTDNTFQVIIANDAPTYTSSPGIYVTNVGVSSSYTLPTYTDFEVHKVTQTIGTIPVSFIVWNTVTKAFDISPSSQSDVGNHSISLTLSDG